MTSRWELIADVADRLDAAGVPSPDVDARWLVDAMVDRFGDDLSGCDRGVLDALVARRARREPLQLVLGSTAFRWVRLACRAGVFVPRPETEVVAGAAIDASRAARERPRVVEPFTGTGAIACAIASEVPGARILASDASARAVAVARENVADLRAGTPPRPWRPGPWLAPGASVEVRRGDRLAGVPAAWAGTVDVLVANPPYLPGADASTWAPEVADHDPREALVGGTDGHEVVDDVLAQASTWLAPGGTVVIEIDDRRGAEAVRTAQRVGLREARTVVDLTGRDRAVVARRPADEEEDRSE